MKKTFPVGQNVEITVDLTIENFCVAINPEDVLKKMDVHCFNLFKETANFVRADGFAVQAICEDLNKDGLLIASLKGELYIICIGSIADYEIALHLEYRKIGGRIICFYSMEGDYAIWPMADAFLKKVAPNVLRFTSYNFTV